MDGWNGVWQNPPPKYQLSTAAVQIWRAWLDPTIAPLPALAQLLSEDEQGRAERFRFEIDRQRFTIGRGILRLLLGRYLNVDPERVKFEYGDRGKPQLATPFCESQIQFNLAHSQGLILYALTLKRCVGIDLEQFRPISRMERLAARYFSTAENEVLRSLPELEQQETFFKYWTCKEATLKASGAGLALPTHEVEVCLDPVQLLNVPNEQCVDRWSLLMFTPEPQYVAALTVEGRGWEMETWDAMPLFQKS